MEACRLVIAGFYSAIANHRYKSLLTRYTKEELSFPGGKIENIEVDKLYTYFDKRDYLINNAVSVESYKEGKSFNIKAWQHFLNYKPFTYKFAVNSEKENKSVVRIFLGPVLDEGKHDNSYFLQYYKYFFMLDEFEIMLKPGVNTFERLSSESYFFKGEYMSGDMYYKKIINAIEGNEPFTYSERMWGFPDHLMLPKGMVDGMKFKMFFYIGPYEEVKTFEMPILGLFKYYGKSFGFPLDRPVYSWFFQLENCYFKDIFIYHSKDHNENKHIY